MSLKRGGGRRFQGSLGIPREEQLTRAGIAVPASFNVPVKVAPGVLSEDNQDLMPRFDVAYCHGRLSPS